jgi:hypothetical protein
MNVTVDLEKKPKEPLAQRLADIAKECDELATSCSKLSGQPASRLNLMQLSLLMRDLAGALLEVTQDVKRVQEDALAALRRAHGEEG